MKIGVFSTEAVNTTSSINETLFPCVERMTLGANLSVDIIAFGRKHVAFIATGTGDFSVKKFWMYVLFHDNLIAFQKYNYLELCLIRLKKYFDKQIIYALGSEKWAF